MDQAAPLVVVLVGLATILASIVRAALRRIGVPSLVGFIALGVLFRLADSYWHFMDSQAEAALGFLADVGVVILLFRIGLESNLRALMAKLPQASVVWLGNIGLSGIAGFVAARYGLGLPLVTALVVAVALTATSVDVSLATWRHAAALRSANGRVLLDVVELDDISGIALMTMLLVLIPVLMGGDALAWRNVWYEMAWFFAKLGALALACVLFARYLVNRLMNASVRLDPSSGMMLIVIGVGLIIAAVASWLGLALAIGALFAGLVFSSSYREAKRIDPPVNHLYAFFTPFFFIEIGHQANPAALAASIDVGLVLLTAAVIGKLVGSAVPALFVAGGTGATLIAVSTVPRAEIAMIVTEQGRRLGPDVIPDFVYAGMMFVVVTTSLVTPIVLRWMLHRWPQPEERLDDAESQAVMLHKEGSER